jgi:hypothetical protein
MTYEGRFSEVGDSKSYVFEPALFRTHPEFDAHDVEAHFIGPGILIVRVIDVEDEAQPGHDPVLGAFVAFMERDMIENPSSIQPLSSSLLTRAEKLVGNMEVDLDERSH